MIRAEEITKRAGHRTILKGITLSVAAGEIVALLGPNGAGKSTLLKILALLGRPTTGRLWLGGKDALKDGARLRSLIGVVLHEPLLYESLTALENLTFYGKLYGLPAHEVTNWGAELLEQVGLTLHQRESVGRFSQGMRQRLSIARALLHRPSVLLLDEPFTSLDQEGAALLAHILRDHRRQGRSVLLVTHQWEHALELADRVVMLSRGEIAADRPAAGLDLPSLRRFSFTPGEEAVR